MARRRRENLRVLSRFLLISFVKTVRKCQKRVQKAQNFPACGGPVGNNGGRLSIRSIWPPKAAGKFWGISIGVFPPLVRYISRTRGGKNSSLWVDTSLTGRVVHAPDLGFCSNSINFLARLGAPKFVVEHFRGRESTYLEEYIVPVCLNITQLHLGEELQSVEVSKKIQKIPY